MSFICENQENLLKNKSWVEISDSKSSIIHEIFYRNKQYFNSSKKHLLCHVALFFTPQPLRAVGVLFSPMVSGWAGGWVAGKVCQVCISETLRCRKLILRHIGWGCRCATSWCDFDLTFVLAVVTLTYKILSGLYLRNHKV